MPCSCSDDIFDGGLSDERGVRLYQQSRGYAVSHMPQARKLTPEEIRRVAEGITNDLLLQLLNRTLYRTL